MGTINQSTEANDYAIAMYLNERVWKILWHVADLYPFNSNDLDKINRNYIFLVHELSDIYSNNKELQDIEPKPTRQRYKQIDGYEKSIADIQDDRTGDTGQTHTAEVRRLCIIKGKEEPDLNARQKKLIAEADEIIAVLYKEAEEERKHLQALQQQKLEQKTSEDTTSKQSAQEAGGQIAKLSLNQKVLKLNFKGITYTLKEFDSTKRFNYALMKYLLDNPDEWVSENWFKNYRMRTKIKDWPKLMGFTGELKDIFIDVDTKEQKIILNPQKSLTSDEVEILKKLVKTLKVK